jgi:hypothetical protein
VRIGWPQGFRVILGVAIVAAVAAVQMPWPVRLGLVALAGMVIFWGGEVRPAVSRAGEDIVCRYLPWRLGRFYFLVMIAVLGVALLGVLWPAGVALLALLAWAAWSIVRMWRRCRLQITPSSLTLTTFQAQQDIQISREDLESVAVTTILVGTGKTERVEIVYRTTGGQRATVNIGPSPESRTTPALQLTVQPDNLHAALQVWKDGDQNDPQLLDRVESVLRSGVSAGS